MPRYDLAGNPLPEDGTNLVPSNSQMPPPPMPQAPPPYIPPPPVDNIKYDLAGNPLPPAPGSAGGEAVRYDLAGNPLPPMAGSSSGHQAGAAPPYVPPPPPRAPAGTSYSPGNSGGYAPPPSGGPYGSPSGGYSNTNGPIVVNTAGDDNKRKLIIGIGAGAVGLLVIIFMIAQIPKPINAVTKYITFIPKSKGYNCEGPEGWDTIDAEDIVPGDANPDNAGVGGVLFRNGPAKIDITTDKVATLMSNTLMNSSQALPDNLIAGRAYALHKQEKKRIAGIVNGYDETKPVDVQTAWGEAVESEWTASGAKFALPHPIHGYRVSMVGSNLTCEVICQCPETNWATLKPAFEHVIQSLSEGVTKQTAPQYQGDQPSGGGGTPGTDYSQPNYDTGTPAPSPDTSVPPSN